MNTHKHARPWLRLRTSVLAGGGVALSTLGLASGIAQATPAPEATVALKSTNPAVDAIIKNGTQPDQGATVSAPLQQLSYYNRYFRRFYTRYYHRW